MIKRIIIEGPDCSGKSTMVDRIKNALRWDSKSLHHREGDQFERYIKEYLFNERIVFDRSHISEVVYSNLWRGGNPFSQKEEEVLDFLVQKDTLVIFCCPDLDWMKKVYLSRPFFQQIKIEELEKSRELFVSKLNEMNFILYTSKNFEELEKLIKQVKGRVK